MKKTFLIIAVLFLASRAVAQEELAFPFQGGKEIMTRFFKDSLIVSPEIIRQRATGVVVFKFTADDMGRISRTIIYYADDQLLVGPVIDALKKSNRKWIIPNHEKFHDFIVPFAFNFNPPPNGNAELEKAVYKNYLNRKPISATNQVPIDMATLLPTVMVNYDIPE